MQALRRGLLQRGRLLVAEAPLGRGHATQAEGAAVTSKATVEKEFLVYRWCVVLTVVVRCSGVCVAAPSRHFSGCWEVTNKRRHRSPHTWPIRVCRSPDSEEPPRYDSYKVDINS
jgi:hypothetical protein